MNNLDIDSGHEGLITSEDQLVPGLTVWHVYGRLQNAPTKEIILSKPYPMGRFRVVDVQPDKWRSPNSHFLDDVGITEAPFNNNRLFLSEDSALLYIEKCINAGIRPQPKAQL